MIWGDRAAREAEERALLHLQAQSVAIEFVLWSAERGRSARQCLEAIGLHWPARSEPTWHDAVLALAIEWRRLQTPPKPKLRLVA